MKKTFQMFAIVSVMALLPYVIMFVASFYSEEAGFNTFFVSVFAYIALYYFCGIYAGNHVKQVWFLPLLPTVVLELIAWIQGGDPAELWTFLRIPTLVSVVHMCVGALVNLLCREKRSV